MVDVNPNILVAVEVAVMDRVGVMVGVFVIVGVEVMVKVEVSPPKLVGVDVAVTVGV